MVVEEGEKGEDHQETTGVEIQVHMSCKSSVNLHSYTL